MNEPASERPIVDWVRSARRLRAWAMTTAAVLAVGIPISWLASGSPAVGTWLFFGIVVMFVAELTIVGGSAIRGMFRAGERGHRLARPDVSLLPATRRRAAAGGDEEEPTGDLSDGATP